jgi:signal transduction histidine kinase/AraC-like DNA-binding protein
MFRNRIKILFILCTIQVGPGFILRGQPYGKFITRNFDQLEIGSENGAFWAVVKDNRGILYFGGEGEIFEFDGISWRGILVPNFSAVRSLAVGKDGTVYVGAVGELGFLRPNMQGRMEYQSLLPKIPKNKLSFPDVWSINIIGDDIFFQADNRLFRYRDGKMTCWELKNSYHRSFAFHDKLIINQREIGLCALINDSIQPLPNGSFFKNMIISSITGFLGDKALVGTRKNGLFIADLTLDRENEVLHFKSEASEFLKTNQLYYGINLPDGRMAFATLRGGVIITGQNGNILKYINKSTGFIDYTAFYLNIFNDDELWITSSKGVGFYNVNSAISYWNDELGIKGSVNALLIKNDILYVGSQSGLFFCDINKSRKEGIEDGPTSFEVYKGMEAEVWDIIEFEMGNGKSSVLASTGLGLYNIVKNKIEFPSENNGEITICQSKKDPSILYYNTHPTFYILKYKNGKWNILWKKNITSYVLSLVEDVNGDVWLGTKYYGVFRINLCDYFVRAKNSDGLLSDTLSFKDLKVEHYNTLSGLPNLNTCVAHMFKNKLIISCDGLFSFDEETKKFVRTTIFGDGIQKWNKTLLDLKEDKFGNVWGFESEVMDKQPYGSYKLARLPYQMLTIKNSTQVFLHDDNGITWIGGEQGLFRYDSKSLPPTKHTDFVTLIRSVSLDFDSTVFYGANFVHKGDTILSSVIQPKELIPSLNVKNKSITFTFACPYFQDDIPLEYSYYLEGYEKNWSEWTSSTTKEYNNLRENDYTFHVRTRNYLGNISREATYEFIIKPPWYRTVVAYILYVILIGIAFYASIKIYSIRLRRYNIILERTVKERTNILEKQKEEINQQTEILKSQNEKLIHQKNRISEMSKEIVEANKSKLQFFTNISHELRTPLTLIIGPVEELMGSGNNFSKNERDNLYSIIYRNASRLLALVNQILDFRKIEIQSRKLSATEGDIISFVQDIGGYFKDLATKKNIEYGFASEFKRLDTWFDPDSVEKIVFNLISNAFKYTRENGKISISVSLSEEKHLQDYLGKVIIIAIEDNGIGIEKESISKIFDRYYQGNQSLNLSQAGTGIGLSMCAKLAELHHGKIILESEVNQGSTFSLILPYGKEYLLPEEIRIKKEEQQKNSLPGSDNREYIQFNSRVTEVQHEFERSPGKFLVMIVEDSEDIRLFIKQSLSEKFDFLEAEDGEVGLRLAKEHFPDLIISDVMMPKMDGYEFCTKIRETVETSHIPIIMLTSKSGVNDQKIGLEKGADDYITKPFNIGLLETRILNLIRSRGDLRKRYSKEIVVKPTDLVITSTDEKFLEKAIKTVEDNMSEPNYGIEEFSRDMAMSQSTLYRKLKALTDESTNNFMKSLRLNRAASLLSQNEISVSEIANMVGFDDPAYFSKSFKMKFGTSPSEYSKKFL